MDSYRFNIAQLITVTNALGELLPKVTFVGGCTTALLVDESAYFGVRQTKDVDVIVDVTTYVSYQQFCRQLRGKGFAEDVEGPNCRWLLRAGTATIQLDVMAPAEEVLGFTNRWYPKAIKNASPHVIEAGLQIAVVSPVYFLASKFEAFANRGNGDYFSHDIEDIVFVLENRSDMLREILNAPDELKEYLAKRMGELLNDDFLNVLPGILNNKEVADDIENMLRLISRRPWNK